MNELLHKRNTILKDKVLKGLKSRNMTGYYADNKEEALKIALDIIKKGNTIGMGGSQTVGEIGLLDVLKTDDYNLLTESISDSRERMLATYDADVFLSSANGITEDGILINIDGNANRVSAIAQGPKKVLFIVGMNKIASDLDSAMKRARNTAAPANAIRIGTKTPCVKTGNCFNCMSPDTICCQFLITRFSRHEGRIHVILVNEELGF